MKIVYVYHSFALKGGIERIFADKMNYLADQMGHEVYFITYEQSANPPVYPLSTAIKWINIDIRFFSVFRYGILKRYQVLHQLKKKFRTELRKELEKIQPDVLVTTTTNFTELDEIINIPGKWVRIVESHIAKISGEMEKFYDAPRPFTQRISYALAQRKATKAIRKADQLVALTKGDQANWGNSQPSTVIPNILTCYPETLLPRTEHKRVVSAGRLVTQKGYELLVNAWGKVHEKHPDWVLDIYGEGEKQALLLEMIRQKKLEQVVHLLPFNNDIYEQYMGSDFYVLSSLWEGFGLVLIEAMSCGIPCISFDCPYGPSDIIRNNIDGILVENANTEQLAEKIGYLIEHPDIRTRMGDAARENVKRFLPENIMPQWEALFKSLIEKTSKI